MRSISLLIAFIILLTVAASPVMAYAYDTAGPHAETTDVGIGLVKDTTATPTTHETTKVATPDPTKEPTRELTAVPTTEPTKEPTAEPTKEPTKEPTLAPTKEPTKEPTAEPTREPTKEPSLLPTKEPIIITTGWVTVLSSPIGADVTIDGVMRGQTPLASVELTADTDHSVSIAMAGYETYTTTVKLTPGEHTSVDATLKYILGPGPVKPETSLPTPTPQPIGGGKGWIKVSSNVNGATVSFDELSSGCTIADGSCTTEVAVTGTPFKTFTVQKPGYQIYTGQVTSWPKAGETVNLYATLNPSQTYGAIQVYSSPSGASVMLDGITQQYTPASFSSVTAGTTHIISVTANGYQPYVTSVWVNSGQSSTVRANLVPITTTGSLSVSSSPSGADVYVDGNYMGYTPAVVPGLAPGSHTVRIQKAGYDEFITTARVTAGERTPVSVTLGTLPPTLGSIEVASAPSGAAVYLDGSYMGMTQPNDYFDLPSILQGGHTVTLRMTDYQDYTQTVFVGGGKIVTINAVLTPQKPGPVADTTGQINLVSTPPGASVFLDNVFKGITPLTMSDIPQGSHIVTLKLQGYADAVQTVTVTGGQTTPVALGMSEAAPAPTRKSPSCPVLIIGAILIAGIGYAAWRK